MKLFSWLIKKPAPAPEAAPVAVPPELEGAVTHVNDEYVAGWAWDRARPDEVVEVLAEAGGSARRIRADRSLYTLLRKRRQQEPSSVKFVN